ncbi:HAD family hydrolase [Candidatus Pacearchaeota archaeon]|nr:HAD family hydrolase [Candidatus Pacearchaeota archaeon]
MIKAIIFGLWETIATKGFSVSERLMEQFNIKKTSDFLERYEKALQLRKWRNKKEMAENFLMCFDTPINYKNCTFIIQTVNEGINRAKVFSGIKEILLLLKKKYKLGILSNTTNFESNIISLMSFNTFFDVQLYSWQINSLKPSGRSFEEICKRLQVNPDKCLFIDNEDRSINEAKKLGFNTIKFKNVEQLKKELLQYY